MKAPKNVIEFKNLISEMCHRERFVFSLNDKLGELEIYATYTQQGYGKKNICLQVVDEDGTSKQNNKLLDNWSDSYFLQIFSLLKQQ
jgi:hypothetical protein